MTPRTFRQLLTELTGGLPSEDVLHAILPLMRQVGALHAMGQVADLKPAGVIETDIGTLVLVRPEGIAPQTNQARLRAIQPHMGSALRIVGEYRVTIETDVGAQVQDLRTEIGSDSELTKPSYLNGYICWEQEIGHHDEITDIFVVGLILASLACGLDLDREDDLVRFSAHRTNLFRLNRSLHPVIAALIVEMTALNRHERATDLASLARRLEDYRDQPLGLDVERLLSEATGAPGRREKVLTHLRDRLFDLSRRNRLIHFRPTQSSVNLTVASVPIVMRIESIRSDQLSVWGGRFAAEILSGSQVPLGNWLRFEDQPYLPSAFDRIIQETRRDRAEYGFSHLRLVVAFLRWHNLREAPEERIQSPLLWLTVEVVKKKGVRDQYMLRCNEPEAEFNPALRHYFRQLYDIQLPETVNLAQTSIEAIRADLAAQIHRSEPGVSLTLTDKPQIRLIHEKAVQRLRHFKRRRALQARAQGMIRPDFSYAQDDYRPLGLALFEKYVQPTALPQRIAVGAPMPPRADRMLERGDAESTAYALAGGEGHRFSWEIDLTQVTLANFNYRKMSLVQDYAQLLQDRSVAPSFDRVFSIEPRALEEETPPPLPHTEHWAVVSADATQEAAVAYARTGENFIIQGPPGTGKSQTITNLIADFAARGKRVLFVCEKRAALDVVFSRLRQAGLERLACLIHDSQEDKKAFVLDLKDCYERWSKTNDEIDQHRATRDRTIEALTRHLGKIEAFEFAMARIPNETGASLRALVRRRVALPEPRPIGAAACERLPSAAEWDRHLPLAQRVERSVIEFFGIGSLAAHPFARLSATTVAHERSYAEVERMVAEGERLFDTLDPAFEHDATLISPEMTLADALTLVDAARLAMVTNLAGNLDLLDNHSPASADLALKRAEVAAREKALAAAAEMAARWTEPLTVADTGAALEQARAQEPNLFKFLSGRWRRLKRTVTERYAFTEHAVAPTITTVLEWLSARHAATAALAEARETLDRRFATSDANALVAQCEEWATTSVPIIRRLIANARASADPVAAIEREALAIAPIKALGALCAQHMDGATDLSLGAIAEAIRDMREGLEDLPDLLPLLRAVDQAGTHLAFAIRSLPYEIREIEALVLDEAIARLMRDEPALQGFLPSTLSSSARRAARARALLLESTAATIRATCHRTFRDHVRQSTLSVTQLDDAGREFKKAFSAGRRELEHEFGKTMRYRSIRDLADNETGMVVSDLKPIWLMSPLSVSDTLPLGAGLFDVVLFDEASQIPMEEAVPALCRAPQVIVVGDEMQLPPTSFFAAARNDDEMQVTGEDADGEEVAILLDADSLLNQAARTLPATLLAWHYRSRSEALISFSNAAFYDGRLVTIPDRAIADESVILTPLRSDAGDAAAIAVDRLLSRAVSFHPVADGLYEKRANLPEARLIAAMVCALLAREAGLSIGIVAFSEAQQAEIESALDTLAAEDASFAARLDREYVREDDGQINGLFVKNLENVQGDERDIILLSICYAPDRNGRMAMNFGPINQRGGEKRLNVIFSRARHHMAVISTIRAEAITNTHNDGARALRTFLAFADAQARGDAVHGQAILATLNPEAERIFARAAPVDAVRDAIAGRLRERGHEIRTYVGSATFRCDLTIMSDDGKRHALAILLDGATSASVYDRYVFQPGILRSFGWRVIDIPSQSWLRDPEAVLAQIEAALRGDYAEATDDDPFDDTPSLPAVSAPMIDRPAEPAAADGEAKGRFTELRFKQGASDKFWKIAVTGNETNVVFGRSGTKGSTVVKSFETAERAQREADKLILEKLRKGYVEIS
jgi:predicted DNA-binding WGR domain protein